VWNPNLAGDYDRIAEAYAEAYFDELDREPFDRNLLDRFAGHCRGRVCDLGCGPGHVAGYLQLRGIDVFGVDLSPGMIDVARRRNSTIQFKVGDMRTLDMPSESLEGIISLYAIIHLKREAVVDVLREIFRVLQPSGKLLLACHRGQGEVHADERFGQRVCVDATLFDPDELRGYLMEAGFRVEEVLTRKPYEFEFQMEKVYVFAMKPDVAD
jgi:SAM-dependent methyltransferase